MKWGDWSELVPDPRQLDQFGGVRMTVAETSPAIQRRLEAFGRRQVPVRREYRSPRPRRPPLRERLRVALGLVLLAALVVAGKWEASHGR